jgi:benzylsuccinate CoA-transferase BbsF subunit
MATQDGRLPLHGVKVLELTRVIVGSGVGRFLGTAGADVVHVESEKRLDFLRTSFPYKDNVPGINRAGYFHRYNPDKYGIGLDLSNPDGLAIMKKLVAWADVFIESNVPGMVDKFWLDYEHVRKLNPDIVMLSTSQMGREGPLAHYKGFGVQTAAMAGFHQITGYGDGPMGPFGAYTDMVSIQWLVTALLAALEHRRRTGQGQYIDHSQFEAGVHALAPAILGFTANGEIASQAGNRDALAAPHGCYRCMGEDRWCAIAVYSDEEWRAFCTVLGDPAWTKEDRFASLADRKKNEDELNKLVEEWTRPRTPEDVMATLQSLGVAAGLVSTGEDLNLNPQLAARGYFKVLQHTEIGPTPFSNPPFRFAKAQGEVRKAAPCFGEHTEYVCREILGMSDEEFVDLLEKRVFE